MKSIGWLAWPGLLMLAACHDLGDPTGTWETTAESFAAGIEATFPKDGEASDFARQRLRDMAQPGANWRVTLELAPDRTFRLAMVKPLVPTPEVRVGTWSSESNQVQLTVQGSAAAPAVVMIAHREPDRLWLQASERAPRFALFRRGS